MSEPSSELHDLDLGDKRLEKRADRILKALLKSPQSSIPKACQPWSSTLATYRFFWNAPYVRIVVASLNLEIGDGHGIEIATLFTRA